LRACLLACLLACVALECWRSFVCSFVRSFVRLFVCCRRLFVWLLLLCRFVGLSACLLVGLSACRFVGLLVCWFVGLLVCCRLSSAITEQQHSHILLRRSIVVATPRSTWTCLALQLDLLRWRLGGFTCNRCRVEYNHNGN